MDLYEVREGKTRTQVLAAVADFEYNEGVSPRQKDITGKLPLSKGAVSNNCAKLTDSGLLGEEDGEYSLQVSELVDVYKEHVESSLGRESKVEAFEDEVDAHNEVRTRTKKELDEVVRTELVESVLVESLIASLETTRVQTLREVLLRSDEVVRSLAQEVVTSDRFDGIETEGVRAALLLAVSLNHAHAEVNAVSEGSEVMEYLPGNVPENEMIEYLRSD